MSVPSDELTAILTELRELACSVNKDWAERLNIAPSKAITCCKPSGTTSCVAGTSSGIHPRYSPYYIRRVRIDSKNPLCIFMMDRGIPSEPCVNKPNDTVVFSFPIKAPEGSLTYEDYNAIDHLELWLTYQKHWCDHKPSVTINYTDSSFLGIGQWIWNNWDWVSGISFLPHTDHVYEQAPFEAITKEVWAEMVKLIPNNINWDELAQYEHEDTTTSSHSLACVGGSCEIVDILGEN
jgi:ribonucleoside-diphosphate reductase alpha chain